MGRNIGRIGGAIAGIIAVAFGILDVQDKVPPWLLITLGVVAVAGVLADYFWERHQDGKEPIATVKQTQKAGKDSQNVQSGRDTKDVRFGVGGDPRDEK